MKKLSLLALSLSLSGLGCGGAAPAAVSASSSTASQAIINGDVCPAGVDPTAVAVIIDATITFPGQGSQDIVQPICTGTLIAPDVVMLAAHCLDTDGLTFGFGTTDRADFYVSFEGDLSRFAESQETLPLPESAIPVRDRIANPAFDINSLGQGTAERESDIALLFLEVAVTDVQPEIVITADEASQLNVGSAVRIAGWGQQTQTEQFESPPPGTVGIKNCGASTIDELGPALLQVGAAAASVRKCHGDSGGPTYTDVTTSSSIKRRVIGVTSRAYDQEDCGKGGVDTRVDAYLDFLNTEMTQRCDDGSRVFCDVKGVIPASFYEGAAEGEGDGNEGEGDVGDVTPPGGCPGCAGTPVEAGMVLGLLGLLRRRRR